MKQYLILGGGVAGRQAAEAIRERDADGGITILEAQMNPFYARPMLGELLGREEIKSCSAKGSAKLSKLGIKFRSDVTVQEIRYRQQEVLLSTNEVLHFDKLLIALGRRTNKLPCDQGNTAGVFYMDRLADVQAISANIKSVRNAVVSGSSYQALAAVKGLRNNGINATLVIAEDRLWPDVLDGAASKILETRLQQEGVTLVKSVEIQLLMEDQGRLQGVVVSGGSKLPADLLIVASPQEPMLDCLSGSQIASQHGVEVDSMLKAGMDNIYAAGDVAMISSEQAMGHGAQAGWLRAWKQGTIAGINMAGGSITYKAIPSIRTKVFDLDVVCLGLSGATGEDIQGESGNYPYEELPYVYKKILYKDGKAAGGIFIGDVSEAGIVEKWILKELTQQQCDKNVLANMFEIQYKSSAAYGVLCPVCKFHMQIDDTAKENDIITCPACGMDFRMKRIPNGVFHAVSLS